MIILKLSYVAGNAYIYNVIKKERTNVKLI